MKKMILKIEDLEERIAPSLVTADLAGLSGAAQASAGDGHGPAAIPSEGGNHSAAHGKGPLN